MMGILGNTEETGEYSSYKVQFGWELNKVKLLAVDQIKNRSILQIIACDDPEVEKKI